MSNISNKAVYKTISKESRELLIEKKSKFIASAAPCASEEEALEFLAKIRKEFPDATHNVYAYVIDENQIFRYSDDGEPSQTAGMPVIDTIRKAGLVDCAVVVTRYFGGTLLGTGGLVHAYGSSAGLALRSAGMIKRMLCNILSVRTDYNLSGKVQHFISEKHLLCEDTLYTDEVTFFVCVLPAETDGVIAEITDLTNGRAIINITDSKYIDSPI